MTTAAAASTFIHSIGVNIHPNYLATPQADIPLIIADLAYLGIRRARVTAPPDYLVAGYITLAQAGILFEMLVVDYNCDIASQLAPNLALIKQLIAAVPGCVAALEGPNEPNNPANALLFNGAPLTDPATALAAMEYIYAACKADAVLANIPVVNLSVSNGEATWQSYLDALGTMSSCVDVGNYHMYPNQGAQPAWWVNYALPLAQQPVPGKPVVMTEFGYTTTVNAGVGWVDEATQAKDLLNSLADSFLLGFEAMFIYQLMQLVADNTVGGDPFDGGGLFLADGSAKPAATAIKNLTTLLADTGPVFTPGTLAYATLTAGVSSLLLQKSSGVFVLLVWAEPANWNATSGTAIAVAAVPVVLTLEGAADVTVFDPMVGDLSSSGLSAIATGQNVSSVTLQITDHPLLVEILPVVVPPVTPPAFVISHNATLLTKAGQSLTDTAGDVFSLVGGAKGLQIAVNGVVDASTAEVVHLLWLDQQILQKNAGNHWYVRTAPGVWTAFVIP